MKLDADFFVICSLFFFKTTSGQDRDEISTDYYFGVGMLRETQKANSCQNSDFQMLCHMQCGGDHVCLNGKCYCFIALTTNKRLVSGHKEAKYQDSGEVSDYEDEDEEEVDLSLKKRNNWQRRHQIAHFCSNLRLARKCINKCMEQGKPAFCGKDHVCYCGHTETHIHPQQENENLDAYTEFKDMYNKYFHGMGLNGKS